MDHLIGMLLGGLLGWTATLFIEHRRWLPTQGDLLCGLLGGLAGSLTATALGLAVAGTAPTNVESLAALVGAGVTIAVWRSSRSRVSRVNRGGQTA